MAGGGQRKERASCERKQRTEWHRVVCFGRLAEIVSQYLKKGSNVYLEGRIRTRQYTDRDNAERSITEVIAYDMRMLDAAHGNGDQVEEREKCAEDTVFLDAELYAKGNENP